MDLLFLVIFISFYISRWYRFSQIFKTSFKIIWNKISITNFLFNKLTQTSPPPTPLTAKICSMWEKFFANAPLLVEESLF